MICEAVIFWSDLGLESQGKIQHNPPLRKCVTRLLSKYFAFCELDCTAIELTARRFLRERQWKGRPLHRGSTQLDPMAPSPCGEPTRFMQV
eukprot:s378_g14.t2